MQVEPFETIVNDAFERFSTELEINMDPFGQQQNDETFGQQSQQLRKSDTDNCDADSSEIENQTRYAEANSCQKLLFSDEMINEHIISHNEQ